MTEEHEKNNKILVLDFDHTCYDTDDFLFNEIRKPMLKALDIPVAVWEKSYRVSADAGYTLREHWQQMTNLLGTEPCSLKTIDELGEKINFTKYLYDDVSQVINEAKAKGYRIIILSFGAGSWQDLKVHGAGLDKSADEIIYSSLVKDKAQILKDKISETDEVIFVDNKSNELDSVFKLLPWVKTYLINRVPMHVRGENSEEQDRIKYLESRRIAEEAVPASHQRIDSLKEIIL